MRDVELQMVDPLPDGGAQTRGILCMLGYGDAHVDRVQGEGAWYPDAASTVACP